MVPKSSCEISKVSATERDSAELSQLPKLFLSTRGTVSFGISFLLPSASCIMPGQLLTRLQKHSRQSPFFARSPFALSVLSDREFVSHCCWAFVDSSSLAPNFCSFAFGEGKEHTRQSAKRIVEKKFGAAENTSSNVSEVQSLLKFVLFFVDPESPID